MFSTADTIVAVATPPGRGGIGVVRVSGRAAHGIASALLLLGEPLVPRHATFTRVKSVGTGDQSGCDGGLVRPAEHISGRYLDQVVATYFERPASYTGEDVVEISAHGSPAVLREIVKAAMEAGARLAAPGEFTFRAFLNGRIDLVQAEAVADLVDAVTPLQARAAFDQLEGTLTVEIGAMDAALFDLVARLEASVDFPEEGYHFVEPGTSDREIAAIEGRVAHVLADARRGRLIREGAQVAIVGKPNVGKSSLFNALVGCNRAIVAPLPGTTRDFITELTDIAGFRITLIDTAGERGSPNDAADGEVEAVEREGIVRARGARSVADLVLVVLDRSLPLEDTDWRLMGETAAVPRVLVINKVDRPAAWCADSLGAHVASIGAIDVCAQTGEGIGDLTARVGRTLAGHIAAHDSAAVTNIRHIDLLERALAALLRARAALAASGQSLSEEFILADLQDARSAFDEIVGKRTPDDVLAHIFGRFCIGK